MTRVLPRSILFVAVHVLFVATAIALAAIN
jgi:hypothetical protein